jgi:hypothetical protein
MVSTPRILADRGRFRSQVETTVGLIDFNTRPMPNVIAVTPLFGTQWLKAWQQVEGGAGGRRERG